jgi:CheY-like chemotaxis protein
VLVVDDVAENRVLVGALLRKAGLTVVVAENGRVAIEKICAADQAGAPFHLVFMDMQMPELDGYSATAELRAAGSRLPIVALTANAMPGDRERCLAAGCDEFVAKPATGAQLVTIARRYLGCA